MHPRRPTRTEAIGPRTAPTARLAAALALAALLAACGKPGDAGGGTTRERSMASPANTPAVGLPEPTPGVAPSAAASATGR